MPSLNASDRGREIIKQARNAKGWTIDDSRWLVEASRILEPDTDWQASDYVEQRIFAPGVSLSTWRRFLRGKAINSEVFKAFCQVLGIDWQEVIEFTLNEPLENQDLRKFPVKSPQVGACMPFALRYVASVHKSQNLPLSPKTIEFPSGPVPLDSAFYIERPPIEELAYQEICNPGSVIRIQAPRKMGKSSLILRIIARATLQGYQTVSLDFRQADKAVFDNLDKFLRWFCANISRQLNLKSCLDEYWDEDMGSKICCTLYFQVYLLKQVNSPLVLVLNEVNQIFEYPKIAQEFLPLLRSWHEEAKHVEIWQKLRIAVAHSTEVYIPLHIEQSPFNVGLPLKLAPFNWEQIQDLAQRHGIGWSDDLPVQKLMAMVGGHPYLLRLALYHLCTSNINLEELLKDAPTMAGIYNNHLQSSWLILQKEPELAKALDAVIKAKNSVQLAPTIAYKLDSMGLVKFKGNEVVPSCDLYRLYFGEQFAVNSNW